MAIEQVQSIVHGKKVGGQGQLTHASGITFDTTGNNLESTNVQGAIEEVNGKIDKGSVSVTADGVKTLTQLFSELINNCDTSKLNGNSYIKQPSGEILIYQYPICFSRCRTSSTDTSIISLIYQGANTATCYYSIISPSGTTINNGDNTPARGTVISLHY